MALRPSTLVASVCFVAFLAMAFVGIAPLQDWSGTVQAPQGDITSQSIFVIIFLALLFGAGVSVSRRQLLPVPLGIAVLLGYGLLSVSWAVAPDIALRRLIFEAIVVWMTFRCVQDLGYARSVKALRYTMLVLLVLNYAMVFLTDAGIHNQQLDESAFIFGDWHGILPHKNMAGAICSFTILLFAFDVRRFPKIVCAAAILFSLIFLYYTESRTSETVLMLAVLCGFLTRPYQTRYRAGLAIAAVTVILIALFALSQYSTAIRDTFDDPNALTGRASIWPLLLEYASEHLWTGAGFGDFWQSGDRSPIWELTKGWVALYASHGHNGYLDLLVTIGLPGLVLAVAVLMVSPLVRLFVSNAFTPAQRSLLLALMIFCLAHNGSESSFLSGASTVNVFLMITIALIYGLAVDQRGRHPLLQALRISPARFGARREATMRLTRR